jgi:hypothetical protein
VTYSTNLSAGSTYQRPTSFFSANSSGVSTYVGSNAKTIVLAVGASLGIVSLVGAAIVLAVVRNRRRLRGGWDGSEKWGLVGMGRTMVMTMMMKGIREEGRGEMLLVLRTGA